MDGTIVPRTAGKIWAAERPPQPAGIDFAETGPGDLSLALGYREMPRGDYPREMREARERVFQACRTNRVAFLEIASLGTITRKRDEGVRVIAGATEAVARTGRVHTARTMPA